MSGDDDSANGCGLGTSDDISLRAIADECRRLKRRVEELSCELAHTQADLSAMGNLVDMRDQRIEELEREKAYFQKIVFAAQVGFRAILKADGAPNPIGAMSTVMSIARMAPLNIGDNEEKGGAE